MATSSSASTSASVAWEIVVACMHPNGDRHGQLTVAQELAVLRFADGLGQPAPSMAEFFDWSHVRDSSEQAIERMARALLRYVY